MVSFPRSAGSFMSSPLWVCHCSHQTCRSVSCHLSLGQLFLCPGLHSSCFSSWEVCNHPFKPAHVLSPHHSSLEIIFCPQPCLSLSAMAQTEKHPGHCLKFTYGCLFTSIWLWEFLGRVPAPFKPLHATGPHSCILDILHPFPRIFTGRSGVFSFPIFTHSSDFSKKLKHTSTPRFVFKIAVCFITSPTFWVSFSSLYRRES